jgi:ATP-dependent RNA helicase SUPV3L1/SUV3
MLERLADMIRPLLAWRSNRDPEAKPPKGSTGDGGFTATPEMMSILGCSPEELGKVLKALGFKLDRRPIKVPAPQPAAAVSSTEPASENTSADVAVTAQASDETAVAVETPAEAASVETASAVEPVASTEYSAAPAEVQYEEIWRPRRHHRESHEHRGEGRNLGRGEGRNLGRGEGRSDNRRRDRRSGHPHQNQATSAPASAGDAAPPAIAAEGHSGAPGNDQQHRADRERNRRNDNRGNRESGQRSDRPGGEPCPHKGQQRNDGRPDRGDRGDRGNRGDRGDRRRNDDRNQPRAISAAPPRTKASAEADSPFASLLALRSQLEQARRDKS